MQLPTPSSATTVCRLPRPVMFVPRAVMCNPSSNSPLVVISGWQSCQTEVSVGVSGSCRSIHQTLLLLVRIRFHKVSLSLRVFVVSAAVTGAELCCLRPELLDSWALTPSQVSYRMRSQLPCWLLLILALPQPRFKRADAGVAVSPTVTLATSVSRIFCATSSMLT